MMDLLERSTAITGLFGSESRFEVAAWIANRTSPHFFHHQILDERNCTCRNVMNPAHIQHLMRLNMVGIWIAPPSGPPKFMRRRSPLWRIVRVAAEVFGSEAQAEEALRISLLDLAWRLAA